VYIFQGTEDGTNKDKLKINCIPCFAFSVLSRMTLAEVYMGIDSQKEKVEG